MRAFFHWLCAALLLVAGVHGCTNFLISRGASADGSTMISYAADSHTMYGFTAHFPAADHPPGSMRQIYDWEDGHYRGQIPEAAHTYGVVGNMNELGLAIAESTYGGLQQLCSQRGAILDYGSLITIALQRAATAREAIQVIANLSSEFGYASEGESFSLSDGNEAWVMDLIGKGNNYVGAVWVAMRLPEGYVCAHANQARIRQFPLNDPDNCMYSPDVISFARAKGLYPATAPDEQFSFSDTFCPVDFLQARGCEARVWSFFNHVSAPGAMQRYLDYAWGHNLTNRMPLFVRPASKLSVNDTITYMRDHFEGTPLDFRSDVGAGAFGMPYRWRPLTWQLGGRTYLNERSIGTQQTAFTFVAQSRNWLPPAMGGVQWFGFDDTATAVHVPLYAGITRIPASFAKETADLMSFSFESAFWVTNMVANFAYTRYSLIFPDVYQAIVARENAYFNATAQLEAVLLPLFKSAPAQAVEQLTEFSVEAGDKFTADWLDFWQQLFVKFMDGNVKRKIPGQLVPDLQQPGYPAATLQRIVAETGDRYYDPEAVAHLHTSSPPHAHSAKRRGNHKSRHQDNAPAASQMRRPLKAKGM